MWLAEKVTTLQKENQELKAKIQDIEVKLAQHEEAAGVSDAKHAVIDSAITEIAEYVQW